MNTARSIPKSFQNLAMRRNVLFITADQWRGDTLGGRRAPANTNTKS